MIFLKRILLLFLFSFAICNISAQQPPLNITSFNSSNSISQNTILSIIKDKYGFIWMGTQDGLNKYDGYKITVYKHQKDNPKMLSNNFIADRIVQDAQTDTPVKLYLFYNILIVTI